MKFTSEEKASWRRPAVDPWMGSGIHWGFTFPGTNDARPHPKWWWFSKGNGTPYVREIPRLVKYSSNLARNVGFLVSATCETKGATCEKYGYF